MSLNINGVLYDYINDEVAKLLNYNFSGMDLGGMTIYGLKQAANFQGANLTGATFDGLFSGSNFALSTIKDVLFEEGTKFVGCAFKGAVAYGVPLMKYSSESTGVKEAISTMAVAALEQPINFGQHVATEVAPDLVMQATTSLTNKLPAIAICVAAGAFGAYLCSRLWQYYVIGDRGQEIEASELEEVLVGAADEGNNLGLGQNDDEEQPRRPKKPKNKKRKRGEDAEEQEVEPNAPANPALDDDDIEAPRPKRRAPNNPDRDDMDVDQNPRDLSDEEPINPNNQPNNAAPALPVPEIAAQAPVVAAAAQVPPATPVKARVSRGGNWEEVLDLIGRESPAKSTRSARK